MKNFLPINYAVERLQNMKPSMRYDGKEDFYAWQQRAYNKLYELLGLDRFEKCPLDIEVEYDREVDERREIRFNFRSEEGYCAIARMTFPKNITKPLPLCICLQGHSYGMHASFDEKKYDNETPGTNDRDFALRAVKEGFCAVAIDQRCLGESGGTHPNACDGCYRSSMYELMLGRTTIGTRVWDVMRLIDAVTEKFTEFADVENIVCMGNSGGGTATFYAACMEKRIKAAMPSCGVCTFAKSLGVIWHCSCNYIPHIAEYFDMGDMAGLIAPRKYVQVNGQFDNIFLIDGVQECYEMVKRLYKAAGAEDNCRLVVGEGGHRFYADDAWPVMHELLNK